METKSPGELSAFRPSWQGWQTRTRESWSMYLRLWGKIASPAPLTSDTREIPVHSVTRRGTLCVCAALEFRLGPSD
jgi:hypothetical protein